jgi:hypothetical protein
MQGDDSPAAVRLHAERHGTCTARAGEPRSTTERACFTTCLEATLTCAPREVTLYLAVPSPSSSRLTLPGLTASLFLVSTPRPFPVSPPHSSGSRRLAHRRPLAGAVLGPPLPCLEVQIGVQELVEELHDQGPQFDRPAGRRVIGSHGHWSVVAIPMWQPTRIPYASVQNTDFRRAGPGARDSASVRARFRIALEGRQEGRNDRTPLGSRGFLGTCAEVRVATMLACSSLAAAGTGITDMHARSGPQGGGAAEDHSRRGGRSELRPTERRLLSPEQAATYLGLRSRFAVYRLVASGQLPATWLPDWTRTRAAATSANHHLSVVAGAGFEPATFGL